MRIVRWFKSWMSMELQDIHVSGINEILGTYKDCYGDTYYAEVPIHPFFSKRVKAL